MKRILLLLVIVLAGLVLAFTSCTGSGEEEAPFQINVVPEQLNGHSIAEQKCVFLVTITNDSKASGIPVTISADAPGAEITIHKPAIVEGQVAEVVVIPAQSSVGKTIELIITGNRDSLSDEKTIIFEVVEGEDDRGQYALELLNKFTSWLAANHPELGITSDTEWDGTMVSPQWLVVSHYLFFSEEWEMHVAWHVMIAPHDWAKIDLRHRFDEEKPSCAFEISSLTADNEPHAIEPPETIWR